MADFSEAQLDEWARLVGDLRYHGTVGAAWDSRTADEATANICSAWGGWMDLPEQISDVVHRAIAVGYLSALTDARNGRVEGLGELET